MTLASQVLLCGCGWLGNQLIAPLQNKDIIVAATKRSKEAVLDLQNKGVLAAEFMLGQPFPDYVLPSSTIKTAILMLPPGRRNTNMDSWEQNVKSLITTLLDQHVAHIVFVSTTSVYGESTYDEVNEYTPPMPETASAKAHVNIERFLAEQAPNTHSIVRPAGLIGKNRHPINTLSGRTLTAPNKRVNLVHGDDVVNALMALIALGPQASPLLLCSHEHPQRKAYYDWSANQKGIQLASFTPDDCQLDDVGKWINAKNSWNRLAVVPHYASPYEML